MIPIDKAKELMNRFNNEHFPELKEYIIYQSLEESKRCALISVNEIINSIENEHVSEIFENYWDKVKKEIKNL